MDTIDFYASSNRSRGEFPTYKLFASIYNEVPCMLDWVSEHSWYFDYKRVMDKIRELYPNHGKELHVKYFDVEKKISYITEQFIDLGCGIVVCMQNGEYRNELESPHGFLPEDKDGYINAMYYMQIYHTWAAREMAEELHAALSMFLVRVKVASTLNMVCKEQDYYLYPFEIKKPNLNLELNYGEAFMPVHEKIVAALSTKDKQGVLLLHGVPGSGKTHYIRYLINTLQEKELIYVPPDMAYALSSPDFLPFLMKHSNAVLIIEDAENIIRDRQFQDNQAVANLLNLSDGLLGDCLNLQIIATFNSDITKIDAALLRKGRLIAEWKFDKLPADQAQKLSDQLGFTTKITEPMTLAEIYGQSDEIGSLSGKNTENKKKIGFI